MEGLPNNLEPQMKKIEESDSWLGGAEEEIPELKFSRDSIGFLPEGEALSGGEYDIPEMRHLSAENNEETIADAEIIPENVEDVAEIMLPVLRISISRGIAGGWDSRANMPIKDFIDKEGADLENSVKNLKLARKEECMVYELIKNEISTQTEQERIIRDALIKRASRYCPN